MTKVRSAVGNICCDGRIKMDDAAAGQLLKSEGHVIVDQVTSHQQDKQSKHLKRPTTTAFILADGGSHVTSTGYSPIVSKQRDPSGVQQQVPTHS